MHCGRQARLFCSALGLTVAMRARAARYHTLPNWSCRLLQKGRLGTLCPRHRTSPNLQRVTPSEYQVAASDRFRLATPLGVTGWHLPLCPWQCSQCRVQVCLGEFQGVCSGFIDQFRSVRSVASLQQVHRPFYFRVGEV